MKRVILFALMLPCCISALAQKMKWIYGNFDILKNEMAVTLSFKYDSMRVGKFESEAEYIREMRLKHDESEVGTSEIWEKEWKDNRGDEFEPRFTTLFFKYSKLIPDRDLAQYSLVFHTTRIEPGWNAGVVSLPAYIDGEMWLIKNSEPDKVLAKLGIYNVPGEKSYANTTRLRIGESYAIAGRTIAKFIGRLKKD
jgi:hypothetical protein